jgi:dipeptidase E
VKLLLSSGGATNPSIRAALVELLGKPIEECDALAIPTASYGNPNGAQGARRFIVGGSGNPMVELGWRSVGVLELTALPSLGREHWEPWVRAADVLLVNGGDPMYLIHWIRESGLVDVLPSLDDTVWFGLSAGSMALTPRLGDEFVRWEPPGGRTDQALGFVDFAICPHVDHPQMPDNAMAEAERWSTTIDIPSYAIDDDTAIVVVDDEVTVVSEGTWRRFDPPAPPSS